MQFGFDPHYVMDEMPLYEAEIFLSEAYRFNRDSWEQARMISYIVAQCNSTKRLKPTDIMKFDWDEEDSEEHDTKISNEDVARLKAKAEQFLKDNNNNG